MNRDLTHAGMHRRVFASLFLCAVVSSFAHAQQASDAQAAVAAFHDALFRSTLDHDGVGRKSIDLYWAADALREFNGSPHDLRKKLGALYAGTSLLPPTSSALPASAPGPA